MRELSQVLSYLGTPADEFWIMEGYGLESCEFFLSSFHTNSYVEALSWTVLQKIEPLGSAVCLVLLKRG